jgi:hypothetical protein
VWHRQVKLGDGLLRGEGANRGFFHAGLNLGCFARFGPILPAIVQVFGWTSPGKGAWGK